MKTGKKKRMMDGWIIISPFVSGSVLYLVYLAYLRQYDAQQIIIEENFFLYCIVSKTEFW